MQTTTMQTVSLNVQGMTCGGCVASVTRVLQAVPGVADVSISGGPHAFRPKTPFRERTAFHEKTAPNRSGTSDWSAK